MMVLREKISGKNCYFPVQKDGHGEKEEGDLGEGLDPAINAGKSTSEYFATQPEKGGLLKKGGLNPVVALTRSN